MEKGRLMITRSHVHVNHHHLHQLDFTKNSIWVLHSSSTNPLKLRLLSSLSLRGIVTFKHASLKAAASDRNHSQTSEQTSTVGWDNLGLKDLVPTDYMYVSKMYGGNLEFSDGQLLRFSNIQLNPFSSVLNYGQGVIEGLKAYKRADECIILFRPELNATRMRAGAERLCMPAPSIDHFVEAVKTTVLANRRWVPPPSKGFLYVRSLVFGDGPVLSLIPSADFTFLIYVTPARNLFEANAGSIDLVIENGIHRAVLGGVGNINAIGNYGAVMNFQATAQGKGFHDVLYLDSEHGRYLEEISAANIFLVKDNILCTPLLSGTILPGIIRQSIIEVARHEGIQVEERLIPVDELFQADEVFCTSNSIGVLHVGSITYQAKRVSYRGRAISDKLNSIITDIQMGLTEDKMGWTVSLN